MKKVELLSPVGNFNTLLACINAGCDAVYLSGNRFGARAYADNFDESELLEAIKAAHLFDVSVYLTVNTIIKEKETDEVIDFLRPLVAAGLDGVIVQDLGLVRLIYINFPNLEIHASTQMSITGSSFVKLLQKYHVKRIVPARELSLTEIKNIKDHTGIEIESFIHGAMCYCYSGKCLFSSILGGRSGNRGRCAQPCRLPYKHNNKDIYPLSMKDMCTINVIPNLIEASVDSFKIEGRMKKPVYAAGVTSIYRKYIDLYYSGNEYKILKEDADILKKLYIRSGISEGYYFKHNGKEMITLNSPSYNNEDEKLIKDLEEKYVNTKPTIEITASVSFVADKPLSLSLTSKGHTITTEGEIVEYAKNSPVSTDKIKELVSKMNNTYFRIKQCDIINSNNGFISLKSINELRRKAVTLLENEILGDYSVTHSCK